MNREGILKHKKVFDAWLAGAKIQYRSSIHGEWQDNYTDKPNWNNNTEYRVTPPKRHTRLALLWNITHNREITVAFDGDEYIKNAETKASFVRWLTPVIEY